MKQMQLDSQYVSGLLGSIVGGLFTLLSVYVTTELQEIKKKYDDLPLKICKLRELNDRLSELRLSLDFKKLTSLHELDKIYKELLDTAASIDGKTYTEVLQLRNSIKYSNIRALFKNFANEDLSLDSSRPYVDEVLDQLTEIYAVLQLYEEQLIRIFKPDFYTDWYPSHLIDWRMEGVRNPNIYILVYLVVLFFSGTISVIIFLWFWWITPLSFPILMFLGNKMNKGVLEDTFQRTILRIGSLIVQLGYLLTQAILFQIHLGSWYGWIVGLVAGRLLAGIIPPKFGAIEEVYSN